MNSQIINCTIATAISVTYSAPFNIIIGTDKNQAPNQFNFNLSYKYLGVNTLALSCRLHNIALTTI